MRMISVAICAVAGIGLVSGCSQQAEPGGAIVTPTTPSPSITTQEPNSTTTFGDGTWRVGNTGQIVAGTYFTLQPVTQPCTITISESGNEIDLGDEYAGDATYGNITVNQGIVTIPILEGSPSLNVKEGQIVTSKGCGTWEFAP